MITMNELVDLRMQQHIAHEIYRQQIMQRIPDPFPPLLPIPMPRHVIMPPRVTLPGVEVTLQNDDLWKQFHHIGTEMIITKCGRRMFPSMRLSLAGLEEEANYCVLLEMVPIGDCRYKFSSSQWVPAGGAEPQSPQRMYLHSDSPASGAHWQAQPILFNKVKLTNNTLDNNGHIVLASMHKYQPRIHVIRTSDLTQIPWAPQQAFVFPETEFVAVTAYQNDRITKLKIDNNPFAKGFRETGQSRCKRKMSLSPSDEDQDLAYGQQQQQRQLNDMSPTKYTITTTSANDSVSPSICSEKPSALHHNNRENGPQIKCMRSNGSASCSISSLDDLNVIHVDAKTEASSGSSRYDAGANINSSSLYAGHLAQHETSSSSNATTVNMLANQPAVPLNVAFANCTNTSSLEATSSTTTFMHHFQQNMQTLLRPSLVDLACSYFGRPQTIYAPHLYTQQTATFAATANRHFVEDDNTAAAVTTTATITLANNNNSNNTLISTLASQREELDISADSSSSQHVQQAEDFDTLKTPTKKKGFSISAILGGGS